MGHVAGVTLLGDAAHVMAPFGGHGVNLALLDGAELARSLAEEETIDAALIQYEDRMLARSGPLAADANDSLARFFDAPFTAETAPDHNAAHQQYEESAAQYRKQQTAQARSH